MTQNFIAVDVSKDWIDAHDLRSGQARRVAATARELAGFARGVADPFVVFEASGGYDRTLADAPAAGGARLVWVNPRRARAFARASGRLAKTDRVDAAMLAEMGRALELRPDAPERPAQVRLGELLARRDVLPPKSPP